MQFIKQYILVFLILFSINLKAQSVQEYIKNNAINCNILADTNINLYNTVKNYKFILVGEMHGTKEPADFVCGLLKEFSEQNYKVILGMEIENRKIISFSESKKIKDIDKADFFKLGENDGRNNEAWYNLIAQASKIKNVEFCFFDTELGFDETRDSIMAINISKKYIEDTNAVIITLSGNIHNKTLVYKNIKTMGCYLKQMYGKKVFSINHLYNKGTAYNNVGNGLKVNIIESYSQTFSNAVNYTNYFLLNNFQNYLLDYSAFIFTDTITASLPHKVK